MPKYNPNEKSDLSTKTVLVMDGGLFFCVAQKLSETFGKVLYYNFWNSNLFPTSNNSLIGQGFEEVEWVDHWEDYVDDVDLFIFPNTGHGPLQILLERMGKRVWGSRHGESMEMNRWEWRGKMMEMGLPVADAEMVTGTKELYDLLSKSDEPKFVKIDATARGDIETFKHYDANITATILRELEYKLGAKSKIMNFMVEDQIDSYAEPGFDSFVIDDQYPDTVFFGVEIKDAGWVGGVKKFSELPQGMQDVHNALKPLFKNERYRGNYSNEFKAGNDGKFYLIDNTCRMPCPPIEVEVEMVANLGEIMWYGSMGILVQPEYVKPYGAEIIIHSPFANKNQYQLQVPDEEKKWVKQLLVTKIEDETYVIPQDYGNTFVGAVVAIGDSPEEAVKLCKERVEKVKGYQMEVHPELLDDAIEQYKKF